MAINLDCPCLRGCDLPPESRLPSYVGPASIPLRQARNNATQRALDGGYIPMGLPLKPATTTQGSGFSQGRLGYARVVGPAGRPTGKHIPTSCSYTSRPRSLPNHFPGMGCGGNPRTVNDIAAAAKKTLLAAHGAGDVIARRKMAAVGRGSGMLPKTRRVTFTDGGRTRDAADARRRCRNAGCVAPPKKGALNNPFKSGGGCC